MARIANASKMYGLDMNNKKTKHIFGYIKYLNTTN